MTACRLILLRVSTIAILFSLLIPARAQQDTCQASTPAEAKQDQAKSLAEVAKEAKKNKTTRAKKQITDEDLDKLRGPFPALNLEDVDNSEEIILTIGDYKAHHSAEETEQAVHDWYDRYDGILIASIRNIRKTNSLRQSTSYNAGQLCMEDNADYRQCEQWRRAEWRGMHHDQQVTMDENTIVFHIQQAFIRIRPGISRYGLHYVWFKIRNANGEGSF